MTKHHVMNPRTEKRDPQVLLDTIRVYTTQIIAGLAEGEFLRLFVHEIFEKNTYDARTCRTNYF